MISKNPPTRPSSTILSLSVLTLLITGGILYAGPLTPPAGPVASTTKTLGEVEPRIAVNAVNTPSDGNCLFKITQPGSYYLTSNINGVAGKHGVIIAAEGVTLDLGGFEMAGLPDMGGFDGVMCSTPNKSNITVLNGSLRNWGRDGINLGDFEVSGCRVEGVHARGNARAGIYVGNTSQVSHCSGSGGEYGILTRKGSTVSECSATAASLAGIYVETGSTVNQCAATSCVGFGITALDGSSVVDCTSHSNNGFGVKVDRGGLISNCSANLNTNDGIQASTGSTVSNCIARSNGRHGILGSSACVIRGNTCTTNGTIQSTGAGIRAQGNDNRIEENHCNWSDIGINVEGSRNLIFRNTCAANTINWEISTSNICFVVFANLAPPISGSFGGTAPGSTDPNANFSY